MDALEYFKTKEKMCDVSNGVCKDCPLGNCDYLEVHDPAEAVKIVVKWKEERTKTYQSKLRKALLDADDFVIYEIMQRYCVGQVFGYPQKESECDRNCRACWDDEVLES